jgi:hypothetical protein
MQDSADTSSTLRRWPALYALAYFVVAIGLATLAPFEFHWLAARTFPVWRFTLSDVAQNILLFAPLGIILAQMRRVSLLHAVIVGFLLSASVEFAQLSITGRTSNYVDVMTNTTGALAGWVFGMILRRVGIADATRLIYSLMLLPLCWVIAMRSIRAPELGWLVIPAAVATLAACKTAMRPHLTRWGLLVIWLVMALLPLAYVSRDESVLQMFQHSLTMGMISFAIVASLVLPAPDKSLGAKVQSWLILLVLVAFVVVDLSWFYSQGRSLQWTAHAHLHWAVVVVSMSLLFYFYVWLSPWPSTSERVAHRTSRA